MSSSIDLEKIKDVLKGVISQTGEIEGAALVSYDGIMIANALQRDSPAEIVAAITATLLNLGKMSVDVLQLGGLEQVFIRCQDGYIVIGKAGDTNVVTLMAKREAKMGILINEMNNASEAVLKVLGETPKKKSSK
jgi:predicted regulator of Ras-like GTPase activity (Roadblock/LC7/MglB family)